MVETPIVCCDIRAAYLHTTYCTVSGSSVGIATDYGLDDPVSNPGGVRDFPPVQTVPAAHPASCTMGTRSFLGVEAAGA